MVTSLPKRESLADASPESVVDVALKQFAQRGYADTKLDFIAKRSGMSKRMIHYHFGDKKGLYVKALTRSFELLIPHGEALATSSSVPAESVRTLVDAVFHSFEAHPEALRLILLENIHHYVNLQEMLPLIDSSEITLYMDRLLIQGQDSGAFRTGISAEDVYYLVAALGQFAISGRSTVRNILGLDLSTADNHEGIHRLMVDTVLSFLTSNIPPTEDESYLSQPVDPDEHLTSGIYKGSSIYE